MKRTICAVVVLALHFLSWVSATSRNFAPNNGQHRHHSGTRQGEALLVAPKDSRITERVPQNMTGGEEPNLRGTASMKIGSSPPSCQRKCSGCTPCEPTQVPATSSGHSHMRVEYTNYEPEGWKCKCGPSFYSP